MRLLLSATLVAAALAGNRAARREAAAAAATALTATATEATSAREGRGSRGDAEEADTTEATEQGRRGNRGDATVVAATEPPQTRNRGDASVTVTTTRECPEGSYASQGRGGVKCKRDPCANASYVPTKRGACCTRDGRLSKGATGHDDRTCVAKVGQECTPDQDPFNDELCCGWSGDSGHIREAPQSEDDYTCGDGAGFSFDCGAITSKKKCKAMAGAPWNCKFGRSPTPGESNGCVNLSDADIARQRCEASRPTGDDGRPISARAAKSQLKSAQAVFAAAKRTKNSLKATMSAASTSLSAGNTQRRGLQAEDGGRQRNRGQVAATATATEATDGGRQRNRNQVEATEAPTDSGRQRNRNQDEEATTEADGGRRGNRGDRGNTGEDEAATQRAAFSAAQRAYQSAELARSSAQETADAVRIWTSANPNGCRTRN